ncbi:MAG TPA: hypothetical protein VEU62_10990 [Bryobacterales bacterium]|nr:hypothetical protein [Bryobacterales bacterium]
MKHLVFLALASLCAGAIAFPAEVQRPKAGPVPILKLDQVKPGMKATAWTVFSGTEPEAVPVEIIGVLKNVWGPRQDIILGKMGGKAQRTSVAAGMSGSPVYYDGKLLGAVSLRLGAFTPDAICGITPIELMLEINQFDQGRPADAHVPGRAPGAEKVALEPGLPGLLHPTANQLYLTPIESPLTFTGFHDGVLRDFGEVFEQMGMVAVQGGGSAALSSRPVAGSSSALRPGDAISGVLVSGDMSISVSGTVTYNDGKRVLAFGHPMFNMGPIEMPMAEAEVVHVLASSFTPTKILNSGDVVGALRQDRHSGIMGVLGEQAATIPVAVRVRSFADAHSVRAEKSFRFQVFQDQKWTPQLMMFTLYNSLFGLNDFADESTFRLSGNIQLAGQRKISLSTMQTAGDTPIPAPMLLAGWFGDKFNRLFTNTVKMPRLKSVDVSIDLLPERRVAVIENAWAEKTEVYGGDELTGKVFLRPYRGARIEKDFRVKVPAGIPKGPLRLLVSDADTLNRHKYYAGGANRLMDLPETVSLLNQELSNNQLYISLMQPTITAYYDDKTLPNVPSSVLNVLQAGKEPNRRLTLAQESPIEQAAIPFDFVVSGSYTLDVTVK